MSNVKYPISKIPYFYLTFDIGNLKFPKGVILMMNPLQQLGDLKKMRDQAMALQRELEKEEVTVNKSGVEIVISGAQKVIRISTNGQSDDRIRDAINEAVKKSQEVAAKKLQQMGGMGGLGGLFGK